MTLRLNWTQSYHVLDDRIHWERQESRNFSTPPLPPNSWVHAVSPLDSNFYLWPIFAQTNGPALWQSTWQNFLVSLRGTLHMNILPRKEDGSFTYLRVQRKLWLLLGVNSLSHLKNRPKNLVPPALPDLYLFRFMIMSVLCSTMCKSYN
jgi:hypothetical protein